jgi:hypothetical protein
MSRSSEATALMLRQVFPDREKLLQSPTSSTTSEVNFPDKVGVSLVSNSFPRAEILTYSIF